MLAWIWFSKLEEYEVMLNPTREMIKHICPKERDQAGSYMFTVNNRNSKAWCEMCSKLTIKTPERRQ